MANEVSLTASLSITKPSIMAQSVARSLSGLLFTMNGNFYNEFSILASSGGTALPLGQITQPHWTFLYSNPTFNSVTLGSTTVITGVANNGSGLIRITDAVHGYLTGDVVTIASVGGTTEANGTWPITVITANTFDLVGSAFVNAYTSGGTAQLNNSIRIRNGAGGADLLQLFPGECFFGPLLLGSTPYAIANATSQLLEGAIFSW